MSDDDEGDGFDVEVCTAVAGGQEHPTDECTAFSAPSGFAAGPVAFTHSGMPVAPSTNYVIVADPRGTDTVDFAFTASGSESGETDWSIKNRHYFKSGSGWGTTGSARALKVAVQGRTRTNTAATGKPTISGTATVGQTLTAAKGTVADVDGVPDTLSYQWVRVDGGDSNISGETQSTYTLTSADQGKQVKVTVSFTDNAGNPESRTSDAYPSGGTVEAAPDLSHCNALDPNELWCASMTVGTGTVFGDAYRGYQMGTHGSLTPGSFQYQGVFVEVSGASYIVGGEFTLLLGTIADLGNRNFNLEVGTGATKRTFGIENPGTTRRFEFTNHGLSWSDGEMVAVKLVRKPNTPAVGNAHIYGMPRVDRLVFSSLGRVSDRDGIDKAHGGPPGREHQWFRVDGGRDVAIPGATGLWYRLTRREQGMRVKVRVTFTDQANHREVVTSDPWPENGSIERASNRPADVASGDVLVSNLSLPAGTDVSGYTTHGQLFRTGRWSGGYTLTGITVQINEGGGRKAFDMDLCEAEDTAEQYPSTTCWSLGRPADFRGGERSFTPATALHLEPETNYVAVLKANPSRPSVWKASRDGSEDRDTLSGWSIKDSHYRKQGQNWRTDTSRPIVIVVSGHRRSLQQVAVGPPVVDATPRVSDAGTDGRWTKGETVEVTVRFSEAVDVDTTGGTPTIGIALGGTESRSASYARGGGTTELVFAYTLGAGDGSATTMSVTPDSVALNGGTIRARGSGADAVLGHHGAAVAGGSRGRRNAPDPASAWFSGLDDAHDGSSPVAFELHFSEEPQELSYKTVGGALLEVTGGRITGARRLTPHDNTGWEVTAQPSGEDAIVVRLPRRACDEANAVCIGGLPLAAAVEATIEREVEAVAEEEPAERVEPFTAAFGANAPAEHGGGAVEFSFHLSHAPQDAFSYTTVHGALFTVAGGRIERAWRRTRRGAEKNMHWNLRVVPDGDGDVTLALKPTTSCAVLPGVCRAGDDAMLASRLSVRIAGPATLSVADARVREADGATLDFVVTLSRQRLGTTTVRYATSC